MSAMRELLLAMVLLAQASLGWALDVRFDPVAESVYAYVGDTGPRGAGNQGLNANFGLIVTSAGAVLIDSGATESGARLLHAAASKVTSQPVRWVINTGGQDHRWLGNAHFRNQGAEVIAHRTAEADMQSRGGDQLAALRLLLGSDADSTVPALPTRWVDGTDTRLQFGDTTIELRHRGGGHTPGDIAVWLPRSGVVFSGDIVYVDRLLAVLPISSTRTWLKSFSAVEALTPRRIVPGHGAVTDLATARAQTREYLDALRAHMQRAVADGTDIGEAIRTFDAKPFVHLRNAADLMGGNASRVYLEVERE